MRKCGAVLQLTQCRGVGYATDIGEKFDGITCIAAPVFDFQSMPVAAVWITGPDMRIPKKRVPELGTIVADHALELSRRLGYSLTETR